MRLEGKKFVNGDTCSGTVYGSEGSPHDTAEIRMTGAYPEVGWAMNREVHALVKVLRGTGRLALRDAPDVPLLRGDRLEIVPGTVYAWHPRGGELVIEMTCTPSFTSEQYEHIEDEI